MLRYIIGITLITAGLILIRGEDISIIADKPVGFG